jgi:hypothetical protein
MSLRRAVGACALLSLGLVSVGCTDTSTGPAETDQWIEVDLAEFPNGGGAVPDHTVLTDQWAGIGILFGAEPAGVDLIKEEWGDAHIFFSPDVFGAIAVFRFVEPGTANSVDATAFALVPWFQIGESAELVGLDETGAEIVIDAITPADIGAGGVSIEMSIEGRFRTVEWRTHGDPGIAAHSVAFKF